MIETLKKAAEETDIVNFIKRVLTDTGYMAMLTLEPTIENQTRTENLMEFINVAAEFAKNEEFDGTLASFLESVSLISDIDAYDEAEDAAVMMTIHSAKGLEFPTVFLAGLEEGLFPGMRSIGSTEDIEEERRLCYVAITRAKENLFITKAQSRTVYGKTAPAQASRFYREIPDEYLEDVSGIKTSLYQGLERFGIKIENTVPTPKKQIEKPQTEATNSNFNKGDLVEHPKFGKGEVIKAQQFGEDAILQIMFETVGYKQLMARFAKLKKIN